MCRNCEMVGRVVASVVDTAPAAVTSAVVALQESSQIPIAITAAGAFARIPDELLRKYFVLQMRCQNVVVQHGLGTLSETAEDCSNDLISVSAEIVDFCQEIVRSAAHAQSVHHSEMN